MPARRQSLISENQAPKEVAAPAKTKPELREEAINGLFQIVQFGCMTFNQFADAGAIGMHGPPLAKEVSALANENAAVAKKLDLLIEVGPYAGIITAALPFAAQILVNHGVFKAEVFANAGVVHPDALAAQMKTQMAEQALAAMRAQAEAEKNLEEQMLAMQEMRAARPEERADQNGNGE
jgi:hypothetical protein